MNHMKKILTRRVLLFGAVASCLLVVLGIVGVTAALPKAEDQQKTTTYIGNLKVSLTDTGTVDASKPIQVNTDTTRSIVVKNEGEAGQFVRVMVLPSYTNSDGILEEIKASDLLQTMGEGWYDGKDGYYYYAQKLEAGKTTTKVFEKIKVPAAQSAGKLTLHIKVEGITSGGTQYRKAFWGVSSAPSDSTLQVIDGKLNTAKD